jgi:hypothetical protein
MRESGNDMYPNSDLFDGGKWKSSGKHSTIKGQKAGGPYLPLPFSHVCRGPQCTPPQGGAKGNYNQGPYFPTIACCFVYQILWSGED